MPPKLKSSTRANAQSSFDRNRTPSTDADVSDNTSATAVQLSSIITGPQEAPIDAEGVRRMRATLSSMGYKQVVTNEPLTNDQTLANMVCTRPHLSCFRGVKKISEYYPIYL